MIKAILLVGGPQKGTRFRPLSLNLPKPLFPVAGYPIIYHHIEACKQVKGLMEIIMIGFYPLNDQLNRFIDSMQKTFHIQIRYLQEFTSLGTGGGLYHFRDQILAGNPELFFVCNADVCCDFALDEMLEQHKAVSSHVHHTIMTTEATRSQSQNYGCIVASKETSEILHYVEKPGSFVSTTINCGVYIFHPQIFDQIAIAFKRNQEKHNFDYNAPISEVIMLETDVLSSLANTGKLYVHNTTRFWSQIKSAGAAIYANRHYLALYRKSHPDRLAVVGGSTSTLITAGVDVISVGGGDGREVKGGPGEGPKIIGDVLIHPTATVHPSAKLGPNVTIGKNVVVGKGVRIRESILLEGATIKDHCCILFSIIGWDSTIGQWSRIEGTPQDPNPNKPFAKLDVPDLFSDAGTLNPSITVIGSGVQVPAELIILNSIVLPHKGLSRSYKNQIIL